MKWMLWIIPGMLLLLRPTFAQQIIVQKDGQTIPATRLQEDIYLVEMDGQQFYLIPRNQVDGLTRRIEEQAAIIKRHEKVLAADSTLMAKYQTFEKEANQHIAVQEKMLEVTDSLYRSYQSLFTDLKKLVGLSDFALSGGLGLVKFSESDWTVMGSLGVGYRRWEGKFQFGKDYRGVLIGVRLPFGF